MKIFITGETRLVDEYALLCTEKGHSVSVMGMTATGHEQIVHVKKMPKETEVAIELNNLDRGHKRRAIESIDAALAPDALLLCSTVVVPATECARWCSGSRLLAGINAIPGLLGNALVETAIPGQYNDIITERVREFFTTLGKEIACIDDRIGMITPRLIAQIVNEGCYEAMQGIADVRNIDETMTLGAGYPKGPFQWLDAIGADQIVAILDALRHDTGQERFAAAPLLRKIALAGEFWKKP